MKGSEVYCILSFRVPTTSVGARVEREREQRGARGQRGVKHIVY